MLRNFLIKTYPFPCEFRKVIVSDAEKSNERMEEKKFRDDSPFAMEQSEDRLSARANLAQFPHFKSIHF